MSQFEEQPDNAEIVPGSGDSQQLDLCRLGSFDHCWKMVAQKITDAAFWVGAELFLSMSAPLGGYQSVRETLARHIRHLFGVFLRWEDILLVPNEHCALEAFAHGFCASGDVVLCPTPYADPELPTTFSARTSVELRPIEMGERGTELELADLERAKEGIEKEGRRVRALLLQNPHPLLGSIRGGDRRLAKILEWTSERDIYLLVDESLAAFDLWEFSSCLSLDHHGQFGQKLVWLWSAAQHLSLPGLEFAAIFVPQPDRLHPFIQTHPCAPLVQFFTAKLLEDFDWALELFARRKSRLDELRRLTIEGMAGLGIVEMRKVRDAGIQWILADLNKYLFPNENVDSEIALREEFAQSGRILMNSGEQLGMNEFGWFRLRVGQSEEEVHDMLNRLKFVLEGKQKRLPEGEETIHKIERIDLRDKYEENETWEKPMEQSQIVEDLAEGIIEEEEDLQQGNELEANEHQWSIPSTSSVENQTSMFTYEDFRRLSMIREEEAEDDILKKVFNENEKKRTNEENGKIEEGDDEVMREVFAIFPAERLRWKHPLVEEKSIQSYESSSVQTASREDDKKPKEMKEENVKMNEEIVEELARIEEHDYEEVKKVDEGEDVRNGLDAEMERNETNKEEYKPKWPTTLTDFSFIEELVRSSATMEMEAIEPPDDFYDEASTEEEEREQSKMPPEDEKEHFQSLIIDVPIRVDRMVEEEEVEGSFDESSDSRRIIEIIDQIFHEAVQIRDFSSSSSDSHPNQAMTTIRQEHWSRSDSGLAGDSPPDLSFSPLTDFEGHQLDRIEERAEYSPQMESPEPTKHEQMLLEAFREGPIQTSTLTRESGTEEERHFGPTAQMLDDSGIFVEMPPGSLSIDFPLLIPVKNLEKGGKTGGIEEEMMDKNEKDEEAMVVDLQFKTIKADEDDGKWIDDLVLMEHDHQEISGKTTVQIRNSAEAKIGWEPLENLLEPFEPGAQHVRVDSQKLAEQWDEEEEKQRMAQAELAAMLSEGSTFCPSPASPTERRVMFAENGENVPIWKPLDQIELVDQTNEKKLAQEIEVDQEGKKFSETLDELEEAEVQRSRQGTFASDDYYKLSSMAEEANVSRIELNGPRKRSKDPIDIVAEWNASRMAKKEEEIDGELVENTEVKLSTGKPIVWEAQSKVILPAIGTERMERQIESWEEMNTSSRVEEVREDGEMVKTIVELGNLPKKPPRSTLLKELGINYEGEEHRREDPKMMDSRQFTKENEPFSDTISIPGRAQTSQVHHRMQMRRRESSKKRRTKSKDRFILEHVNITEVDYRGRMSERIERGERLVTSISTRINRYTPDEFFRRLPFEGYPDLTEQREKMTKFVEMKRRRRTQSVPNILSQENEDEIGRIETETMTIKRSDRKDELEDAKAKNELHCAMEMKGESGTGGRERGEIFVTCRNPEHTEREDHCDPKRLYRIRKSTMMSENGYKKMKREHDRRSQENPAEAELHSKFETFHYEMEANPVEQLEKPEIIRRSMAKHQHKYRRPRRPRSPSRITITTTRGGGIGSAGESIDRVTVRHTPGSNWIVSSIYRTTEYGWERTALRRNNAALEMGRS